MARKKELPDGMVERPGRGGYYADFQVNGKRIRKNLGTDLAAARQILTDLKARMYKADFGILDNDHPIEELRKRWITHCKQKLKPGTWERYEGCLDNILPALFPGIRSPRVSQVTIAGVVAYRETRLAAGKSPRTVNAEVQALSCMLNYGVKPARLIQHNPLLELEPLPHDTPKDGRPLTGQEMQALFAASKPHWRDIWYTYGVTGFRASELIQMEFSPEFVDWTNRELIIPKRITKKRREKRVPMDDHLFDILQQLDQERHQRKPGRGRTWKDTQKVIAKFTKTRIFVTTANTPLQRTNLYRTFIRCCEKAGIETRTYDEDGELLTHVDLHSLRRTFITEAISNGADPATVQQLAGHKTLNMTMNVYHKSSRQTRRAAIGKLSYAAGASAPEHIIPMPECRQNVTKPENETETGAG